jgi:hypothetical protein
MKTETLLEEFFKKMAQISTEFDEALKKKFVAERMTKDLTLVVLFKQALKDVVEGKNLDKWDKDADAAIAEIKSLIEKSTGNPEGLTKLKYELYALKQLIAEQKGL